MNQNARMERFMTRIKIEVSRPKKEIYKTQTDRTEGKVRDTQLEVGLDQLHSISDIVDLTYTKAGRPDSEAHSHHENLLGFRQGHKSPIVLIKGRNYRLKILYKALSAGWESRQDLLPEPDRGLLPCRRILAHHLGFKAP